MSAAVVLAAGLGTRMGGPKALLLHHGEPLVVGHVRALFRAGANEVVVVVRPPLAGRVQELVPHARVLATATSQQAESLAAGLGALAPGWESVWIAPVDTVPARASTFTALATALAAGATAVTPRFGTRGGHPVLATRTVLAPYLTGFVPRLRDVLAAAPGRVRLSVQDEHVAGDLDQPSDLEAAPLFA